LAYIEFVFASRDGKVNTSDRGDPYNMKLQLPDGHIYHLALDQSTTCTGICITDSKFTFQFLCNFFRYGDSKEDYLRALKYFISTLISNQILMTFITEKVPPVKYSNSYGTLRELKGVITSWKGDIDELRALKNECFGDILPQVWKSKIVNKSKGKNRHKEKKLIADDICDIFPELRNFFNTQSAKDYDAFDACGILHGYMRTHHTEDHLSSKAPTNMAKQIGAEKTFTGHVMVFYKTLEVDDLSNPEIVMRDFEFVEAKVGLEVMALSSNHSLYNNYLMAVAKNDFVITYVEDMLDSLALRWQFDLGLNKKRIVCFILKKRILPDKLLKSLKEFYPYEEIIGG
jgi:hypothetical protein